MRGPNENDTINPGSTAVQSEQPSGFPNSVDWFETHVIGDLKARSIRVDANTRLLLRCAFVEGMNYQTERRIAKIRKELEELNG